MSRPTIRRSRCKHDHITVYEEFTTSTQHTLADGECFHLNEPMNGEYTGWINIRCLDCGQAGRFNRYVSVAGLRRIPQWVREAAEKTECEFVVVRA